jgi:hypothetical protein
MVQARHTVGDTLECLFPGDHAEFGVFGNGRLACAQARVTAPDLVTGDVWKWDRRTTLAAPLVLPAGGA